MDPNSLKKAGVAAAVVAVLAGGVYLAKDKPPVSEWLAKITGPGGGVLATGSALPGVPGVPGVPGAPGGHAAPGGPSAPASAAQAPASSPAPSPAASSATTAPAANQQKVEGSLSVVAGDALRVSVTLKNVKAPEPGDTCPNTAGKEEDVGVQARTALGMLVGTQKVSCVFDADGAVCTLPDGSELNSRIAELGWAVGREGTPYEQLSLSAKAAKRGIYGVCPGLSSK